MRLHLEVGVARDWWPWAPGDPERMQGGTERAAHGLAAALARRGHLVTARGGAAEGEVEGVRYLREPPPSCDALICAMEEPPAETRAPLRIAWSHAAQWPPTGAWDRVVVASPWHGDLIARRLGEVDIRVAPMAAGAVPRASATRDRLLYAFSPDRGLHRLLAMWPALWEEFHTPLSITYNVRAVMERHAQRPDALGERLRKIAPLLDQPGVIVHGPLRDAALAALRARARAALYPLDAVLPASELYSLSLLDCCAAGTPLVLSPTDVLPHEYADAARFVEGYEADAWVQAVREVLEDESWRQRALAHAATRTEDVWAEAWEQALRAPAVVQHPGMNAQRWLVLAAGIGHGEAALARDVVDEARRRGHAVEVVVNGEGYLRALPGARGAASVEDAIGSALWADRVVLSSSMTCWELIGPIRRARSDVPMVTLDFTWPDWLRGPLPDLVVSSQSSSLFEEGLAGVSPAFEIAEELRNRIRCVGPFPPTRQVEKAAEVLVYLGQFNAGMRRLLRPLAEALRDVEHSRGLTIRVIGPDPALDQLGGIRVDQLAAEEFATAIARARLAIVHSGAGTVGLARASGTPVLCLTPGAVLGIEPGCHGEREAQVWFEGGWAEHLTGALPASRYRETIEALLDESPPEPEGGGAVRAVMWIENAQSEAAVSAHDRRLERPL